MKHLSLFIFLLACLTASAEDFTYTYEGQTLTYTILDETQKTCKLKEGYTHDGGWVSPGNNVTGKVVIPAEAKNGNNSYKVMAIGDLSFFATDLTSVDIPGSVTTIGTLSFQQCKNLSSVNISHGVTAIGDYAFSLCKSLVSINIPTSVTIIGEKAFMSSKALTSVDIPNSVTTIGYEAFAGCTGLISVKIPDSITDFGWGCFFLCTSLENIYSLSTTPPAVGEDIFLSTNNNPNYIYSNATLYAPQEAVLAYKTTYPWSLFNHIQGIDATGMKEMEADKAVRHSIYYDLNGRRLNAPTKGMNIINGKKVIIR